MTEALLQKNAVRPPQRPPGNTLGHNIDILRATECRVASLEAAAKERESQLQEAKQAMQCMQVRRH